jgi:hypothetical protein
MRKRHEAKYIEDKQTTRFIMKRRAFVKAIPLTALLPAGLAALAGSAQAATTETGNNAAGNTGGQAASGASGTGVVPDYAEHMQTSDGTVVDADGNAQSGFAHTSSESQQGDPNAPYQMPLTQEEQDIMDGKKGPELA